ncbi:hypothetical protein ACHAWF_006822 [Thalassiosira exigua]
MHRPLLRSHRSVLCAAGRSQAGAAAAVLRPRRRLPVPVPRPVSTTPPLSLPLPAAPATSEGPKTAQKKVNKEKRGPSKADAKAKEMDANRMEVLMAKAIDAPILKPPPPSPEERERRYNVGSNYNIGCFKQHNEQNHDLAVKIRMKRYAIRMLPREGQIGDEEVDGKSVYGMWREEAVKLNDSWAPPDHRPIPMFTPPIEGFDPSIYLEMGEED